MDVHDAPLSRVLNTLGLEISYDDRALSAYNVSFSGVFENREKALMWLLENKPFRIEKIGNVFVIVPRKDLSPENAAVTWRETDHAHYTYKGTVVSQATGEWLEYAVVSLFDDNNRLLINGITNSKGQFTVQTPRVPTTLKISYLGYETLQKDIHNRKDDLGVFPMTEKVFQLDETVITNGKPPRAINQTTYSITSQMRYGAGNALELLDKIPGASIDNASKAVALNQQSNILYLVDGIQQSLAYLKHLSPGRVQAVEVIYAASGRFVSDDYAGVINFKLDSDYTGYDLYASNATSLNLSKNAGNNFLSKNNPSAGVILSTRKINIFGAFEYDNENSNIPTSKTLTYNAFENDTHNAYRLVTNPAGRPNNLFRHENLMANGGVNYHITPLQLLGLQADYAYGNTYTLQQFAMHRTDLSNNIDQNLTNTTENLLHAYTFTSAVFYRGQVTNRFQLYGDFSYNYYYNDLQNDYRQDESTNYHYYDWWNEYKHQTTLNLEAKYKLSDRMTAEAGYSNIRRQYTSSSHQGTGFLDYSEYRNKAFVYLSCFLSENTGLKFGIAPEHIRQRNYQVEKKSIRLLPYIQISHAISRTASLSACYATNQSYPALYQLSPMSMVVDTFLTQIGNPLLRSAVRHQAFIELSLWDKLKIMPRFHYIRDGISEVYDRKEYKHYRTFDNINFREYSLHVSYDQPFGDFFRLKNTVMLYHSEALHEDVRSTVNGWTCRLEGDYYHPSTSFGVQLGYYRNMKKNILWQGYQMSDKDYWCITARKELWRNRISVAMSYIPPLALGVRYNQQKEMNTPIYQERTSQNLASYNQMLLLKVSIRLERGSGKGADSHIEKSGNDRER
jgi:hypothetical protein